MRIAAAIYGLIGAGLACYGIYQVSPPAAWIAAGAFVIVDAWRLSRSGGAKSSDRKA